MMPLIIEITGQRRIGKTTAAKHLADWYSSEMGRSVCIINRYEMNTTTRKSMIQQMFECQVVIFDDCTFKEMVGD